MDDTMTRQSTTQLQAKIKTIAYSGRCKFIDTSPEALSFMLKRNMRQVTTTNRARLTVSVMSSQTNRHLLGNLSTRSSTPICPFVSWVTGKAAAMAKTPMKLTSSMDPKMGCLNRRPMTSRPVKTAMPKRKNAPTIFSLSERKSSFFSNDSMGTCISTEKSQCY